MAPTQVNGDMSRTSSRCIRHLSEYPVVKDGLDKILSYSLGQWSMERGSYIYSKLPVPAFVQPYIHKADEYGDKALSALDEKFPATKKPTDELANDAKNLAMRPKKHVAQVYRDEQKRAGDGLMASGTALVHTLVAIGTEVCGKTYSYLRGQLDAASQQIADSRQQATENGHAGTGNHKGTGKSNGDGQ